MRKLSSLGLAPRPRKINKITFRFKEDETFIFQTDKDTNTAKNL